MANFLRLPHPVAAAALASLIVGGPSIAPMSVAFAEPGGHRERAYQNTTAEVEAQTATRRHSLESVLGREVRTRVEEDVGRIIDLLADRYGRVQAAVIEFGGFLGIGTRKIAVEWSALALRAGRPQARRDRGIDARRAARCPGVQAQRACHRPPGLRVARPCHGGQRAGTAPNCIGPRSERQERRTRASLHAPSQRGLDWFTFFVADIQTGFGPFLSVYLTTQKWTQVDIGLVLSIGSIAGLLAQVPGGWVVDLRPIQAARRRPRRHRHRHQRAPDRAGADIRRHGGGQAAACRRELGAGSRHCRHHAGPGGPCSGGRATGSQCPLLPRSATALRPAVMGACGYFMSPQAVFLRYGRAGDTGPAGAATASPRPTSIPVRADGGIDAKPRRGAAPARRHLELAAQTAGCWSSRCASCSFTWRTRRCCRWSAAT